VKGRWEKPPPPAGFFTGALRDPRNLDGGCKGEAPNTRKKGEGGRSATDFASVRGFGFVD